MQDDLPQPLPVLLATRIDSLEQLEALLHLHRIAPRAAAAAELIDGLGVRAPALERALAALAQQGLIEREGEEWRFAPKDEELRARVGELSALYASRRIEVVNAVSAKALARVQALADAFRLRKEKPS